MTGVIMSDQSPRSRAAFISYSTKDREWADAVCAALEEDGLDCWIAPRDILATSEFTDAIVEGLAACKMMVLIFSASANASREVRREVALAFEDKMPVLPFRIEDVSPERGMKYMLLTTQSLDGFAQPRERQLEMLIKTVRTLTHIPVRSRPPINLPEESEDWSTSRAMAPTSPRRVTAVWIVAFAVVSVACVAAVPRVRDFFVNPGFGGPGAKPPDSEPEKINADSKKVPPPDSKVVDSLKPNTLGMKFAPIPGGEFLMGSDASDPDASSDEQVNGQKHRVRISPFEMGTTEVTVGQFGEFVRRSPYQTEAERDGKGGYGWNAAKGTYEQGPQYTWRSPGFPQTDDHPVVLVSHKDAEALCEWLSKAEGRTYRLPTEAEWEYSCRAGQASRYWFGDDPEGLKAVARFGATSGGTMPVGRYRANGFGLFDMHGNVWEWCADWYDSNYYAKSPMDDPPGPSDGSFRVIRGGSWDGGADYCRAASRLRYAPGSSYDDLGLRLVRVPSGK